MTVQWTSKWLAAALAVALVGTNGWWLYQAVDQSITMSYREQMRDEAEHQIEALQALADMAVKGKTAAQAQQLLRQLFPEEEPYEKDGALRTAWIALSISPEGRVEGVERTSSASHASGAASSAGQ